MATCGDFLMAMDTWCGLRLGELIELRRKDVDCEALVLHVTRAATRLGGGAVIGLRKSEAGVRSVHVPPHLRPVLLAHLREHGPPGSQALLFPSVNDPDTTLHHQTLYKQWEHARAAAGRPDLRIHNLPRRRSDGRTVRGHPGRA
jgi:integrase